MIIWFATGNIHKKKELADILSCAMPAGPDTKNPAMKIPWELKTPPDAGIDFDPEETGNTFLENSLIKAAELYRLLGERCLKGAGACAGDQDAWRSGDAIIADDSGLCVDALKGRPGIYSARYGGKNIPTAERNAMLLAELGDDPLRSARFVCAMVLYYGPDRFYAAQETMEGELVKNTEAARGRGGFGYDPILYIPELGRTVAELSDEEKNRLSHRGKAGRAIGRILAGAVSTGNGIGGK